ncbi:MAG: DNA pilot protein [Microvirus sp.]|nr:MAG: DNA pilot protein [Microvirus sp.]
MAAIMAGIGSAAIGAAGSIWSGSQSARAAESNYKHRYQWQMKDLQKAGLNPMLTVAQAPPNVPQPNFPDAGSAAVEGGAKGASVASAVQLQKSATEANNAMANKTMAEGQGREMENLILQASPIYQGAKATLGDRGEVTGTNATAKDRWDAELASIKATAENTAAATGVKNLEADLKRGELNLQQVQVKYADQLAKIEVAYKDAMKKAAEAAVPAAQAEAAFWANAGELGKWAAFLKSLIK